MLSIETLVEGVTTGRVSRRGFLQGAVALGLSASGAVALLEACTSGTQGTSAADLTFVVWSYGVETIKDNIKKLEAKVSGLHVNFQDFAWTNYHDTMVARFAAKTPTDVCYGSDHWLSEWAAAGWLSPLEQKYPNLNAYTSDYFPYVIQGMTYQGKNYGIPYYADTWVQRGSPQEGGDLPAPNHVGGTHAAIPPGQGERHRQLSRHPVVRTGRPRLDRSLDVDGLFTQRRPPFR